MSGMASCNVEAGTSHVACLPHNPPIEQKKEKKEEMKKGNAKIEYTDENIPAGSSIMITTLSNQQSIVFNCIY